MSGYFIAFEGIDGSGKSTAAVAIAAYIKSLGREVLITHEPTKGPIGQKIYDILYHRSPMVPPFDLQKLYIEDRKQHVDEVILPALNSGKVVIADRYWFSTLAHGMLSDSVEKLIELHNEIFEQRFKMPDITFIFDLPAEIAISRLKIINKGADFFEKIEKLTPIRENFLKLAGGGLCKTVVVDALEPTDKISQQICEHLAGLLEL